MAQRSAKLATKIFTVCMAEATTPVPNSMNGGEGNMKTIVVKLHFNKQDMYSHALEADLVGEALRRFTKVSFPVEVEIEVDEKTGDCELIDVRRG